MKKSDSYETMSHRLDEIISSLEKGDMDLDKTLALYEEGVKLADACEKYLQQAKARIEILTHTPQGEKIEAFEGEVE